MDRNLIEQLLELAAGQHSLVTVDQAAALGLTPPMLRAVVERGWFLRDRRGVLAVAGATPSPWRPVVAAALAAGPKAAVSHSTAAAIHHFYGVKSDDVELTVAISAAPRLDGVRVHCSRTLLSEDVRIRSGVPVTTPIRTLIDLAPRCKEALLGLIIDEGAVARLWTTEDVVARLDRLGMAKARGVKGAAGLRPLLALRLGEGNPDSQLEQRVIRVLKKTKTDYVVHHRVVLDGEVFDMDIAWPTEKIDGEVDGMQVRASSRTKFERQAHRENLLVRHGWRIVHFTAQMNDVTLLAQIAPLLACSH